MESQSTPAATEALAAQDGDSLRFRGPGHLFQPARRWSVPWIKGFVKSRLRGVPDYHEQVALGLQLGRDVLLGRGVVIDPVFPWLVSIGDNSVLAPNVEVIAHDASMKRQIGYTLLDPVRIGKRVYVGANSTILPGVDIGDDAIIGAGTVVRNDVAPGTLVVGNPAREVATTADYMERHKEAMKTRPTWPAHGYTLRWGITPERRAEMQKALESGPGYVE